MKSLPVILTALFISLSTFGACQINLHVKNTGNAKLNVINHKYGNNGSVVKVKGGIWKNIRKLRWYAYDEFITLTPRDQTGDGLEANLGCNANRRYRIKYICKAGAYKGQTFTNYYPSATSWTKDQTVLVKLNQCK